MSDSTVFAPKQQEHRQAGLATAWEGGSRARAAALLCLGMRERRDGEHGPHTECANKPRIQYSPAVVCSGHRPQSNSAPPKDVTSGALARAPGPRARLNPGAQPPQDLHRARFIVSTSGEGCGGFADSRVPLHAEICPDRGTDWSGGAISWPVAVKSHPSKRGILLSW